jgi:hypothetical protein
MRRTVFQGDQERPTGLLVRDSTRLHPHLDRSYMQLLDFIDVPNRENPVLCYRKSVFDAGGAERRHHIHLHQHKTISNDMYTCNNHCTFSVQDLATGTTQASMHDDPTHKNDVFIFISP